MNNFSFIKVPSLFLVFLVFFCAGHVVAQSAVSQKKFRVLGIFPPDEEDIAHRSFVNEAQEWFERKAKERNFEYVTTNNLKYINDAYLSRYDVVLFLNIRPENQDQRDAFQRYMESGGAWMGFHFAAFAMSGSNTIQNWDWYHNTFLGSGEFDGNTWKPTSALLKVETRHPAIKNIPRNFASAPNEWYKWKKDLRLNPDITILASIDPKSFPLGNGSEEGEVWYSGDYPVIWTNNNFKMLYFNMGHNDIDYDGGTFRTLSKTFENEIQSQMILDALFWLAKKE